MPDPNARRDKALEDIARSLKSIDKSLDRIARNGQRVKFTNHPYLNESDGQDDKSPDPSASPTDYLGPEPH